jgi:hypothetical protein
MTARHRQHDLVPKWPGEGAIDGREDAEPEDLAKPAWWSRGSRTKLSGDPVLRRDQQIVLGVAP